MLLNRLRLKVQPSLKAHGICRLKWKKDQIAQIQNLKKSCNGCSPIKVKENFTPPSSFQRFQICPDIVFLQLTFVNCIIRYTVDYRCITCCSITPAN